MLHTKKQWLILTLPAVLWAAAARADDKTTATLRVPDGFTVERVAGGADVVFPMFACFDERGRLFVAESSGLDLYKELRAQTRKCRIRLLEDRTGDGRFDTALVFADQLVFPMGLAWRDGKLYVADPPNLITLEDTNGDGRGDRRRVILTGFGHQTNGSLHGLTFGPDGWLYVTIGSPDGYKLRRGDGSLLTGESGALIRCRPDGSEPEVICRGPENPIEVVFTPRGDVVGTVNWFQRPAGGLRDALVHFVEGGLYPYHPDKGTPQPITGPPMPALQLFPAVALSGLEIYRGTSFPAAFRGNLFSAQHNARAVGRHVLTPHGATFRSEDHDFLVSDDPDFHPADVLEDADGSLLVLDTGSWYVHHCPTGKIRKTDARGGIYRIRAKNAPAIADPWGQKLNWQAAPQQLVSRLGDARPAVRDRARRALAAQGAKAVAPLAKLLASDAATEARQQAVWALAGIADDAALVPLRQALQNKDADIAIPAARALAVRRARQAAPALAELLRAEPLPVRLAAAQALAYCGVPASVPPLVQALTEETDRFLEHALIHALHRLTDADTLAKLLDHDHPRVQKAALLLLDQPPRPPGKLTPESVFQRVSSRAAELRAAALFVVHRHPEWSAQARSLLSKWLARPKLSAEEQGHLEGLVLAFQGQAAVQKQIADAVADGRKASAVRVLLLQSMAQSDLAKVPDVWTKAIGRAVNDAQLPVRLEAVRTASVLQLTMFNDVLARLADNQKEPLALRLEALRALSANRPALSPERFKLLLDQLGEEADPFVRLTAAEILGRSRLNDDQLRVLLRRAHDDALIAPAVLLPAFRDVRDTETAQALVEYLAAMLRAGWSPSEAELAGLLKRLPAVVRQRAEPLHRLTRDRLKEQRARLADFEPLLQGGNAARGQAVFFGKKVACAACHRIGSEGGHVGPDLTRIGAVRSDRDLLEAVVLPSATLAQGYDNYLIEMKDGRLLTGVIARQSANAVLLRDSSGGEQRLPRSQVRDMQKLTTSLMPEGLDRALTRAEFRDLLAYLRSLR